MKKYRIIVLGGGAAGIVSAMAAASIGLSVALIEKDKIGGECSWTGCVPSKALLAAAKAVHKIRHASQWNIKFNNECTIDTSDVMSKVRELVQREVDHAQSTKLMKDSGVEIYYGEPTFVSKNEIKVNNEIIYGKDIIIATGSSPVRPKNIGLENIEYYTNQEIFSIDKIPESIGVIGGGAIGIEMAQAFNRLGSKVTLFEAGDSILPRDDKELTAALADILKTEGLEIRTKELVKQVQQHEHQVKIITKTANNTEQERIVDKLLVAIGRKANVENLNLDEIGVKYSSKGIEVNKYLQTNISNIWACGDCIGGYQFSHISEVEARQVIQNILSPIKKSVNYSHGPWATFTDPELAHVGITEQEAINNNITHKVYKFPISKLDRAIVEQEEYGLIKLITTPSGKILGAHILSTSSGELANELLLAMNKNIGILDLSFIPHIYPTWGYGIQRACDDFLKDLSDKWYMQIGLKILKEISK